MKNKIIGGILALITVALFIVFGETETAKGYFAIGVAVITFFLSFALVFSKTNE